MNHIYRLVWCQSRRLLVVASELASSGHGGGASAGRSVGSPSRIPARNALFAAMLGAAGLLFATGASAQSTGDARLDDLQSTMNKYSTPAIAASPSEAVLSKAIAGTGVATGIVPATSVASAVNATAATVRRASAVHPVTARAAVLTAARPATPVIAQTLTPIAAATASIPAFASDAADARSLVAADHTAVALAPPSQGTVQVSAVPVVDVADRRTALATGAQVALQSSSIQVPDAPIPPIGDSLLALPAIKPTVLPIAARLTTTLNITPVPAPLLPVATGTPLPVAALPAAIEVAPVAQVASVISKPSTASGIPMASMPNAASPVIAASGAVVLPTETSSAAALAVPVSLPLEPRVVASVATPAATVAADVIAESATSPPASLAAVSDVADRRLTHATNAVVAATARTTDLLPAIDGASTPVVSQSASTAAATPASFAAVGSTAAISPTLQAPSASASAALAMTPLAVPVFPTPSAQPTGLIVGNGGVIGTTTQLLGPTTNSLFAGGNGYVTNGSLQVSNANFSQGYSVVTLLGIPLLQLNPVGTVLTSTTGAVVGGTGVNSHLTLLGGVTSNNYISDINNGGPNALLGVALPTSSPAYASSCLNALAVRIACYGVNAAQDYQVLVGDGATANGSKEVVIGTNASHTLPAVSADVAFPGDGRNDPTNPTGVPTADYEARLGHSVVVGDSATGTGNAQTILGAEANATAANSVALGFRSAANRGGANGYAAYGLVAPQTSVGEVSIGSAGAERQITNVAAGSGGTDAVNVLQLQAVVSAAAGDSVQYDDAGHTVVTLSSTPPSTDGGVTGGTTITNLHQGALNAASTDAVNGAQLFATNSSITNIVNTTSKYYQANSAGTGSSAAGVDSLAAGPQAVSTGPASVAIGSGAASGSQNGVAIGTGANASFANSVALGNGSATVVGAQAGYTALGLTAPQTSLGEVNVGTRQITGVAAGLAATDAVNVGQLAGVSAVAANAVQYDVTLPADTRVTLAGPASIDGGVTGGTTVTNVRQGALAPLSTDAVNGSQLFATNSTINNVINTSSKYYQANSIGVGSVALGLNSLAAGPLAVSTGIGSIAEGNGATTLGTNSVALGTAASSISANSVALGAGSLAARGPQLLYPGFGLLLPQNSVGEVSVGTVGAERQITNVAAGQLGTDAVNVNQLAGVSAVANNAVQYDAAVPLDGRVTLGAPVSIDGGLTGGTTITNLHQGALTPLSTDAVNGAQLFATNSTITNVINTSSKYYQANSVGVGSIALGIDSLAAGPTAVATGNGSIAEGSGATTLGVNSVALGAAASATAPNSVALGAGSVALRGPQLLYPAYGLTLPQTSAGAVSVGAAGAERQITNVAAGQIGTDAVNVNQLAGVSADATNSVQYDLGVPLKASVTLAGPVSTNGGVTNGTSITNLHQGALSATSTDAVNGAQMFATNNTVTTIFNTGSKYYQANSIGAGSTALGTDSLAAGPLAVATGSGSIAEGAGATTLGVNSVALGTGASSVALNSVALGAGALSARGAQTGYAAIGLTPLQNSVGEVSLGAVGAERQLTNVAAGSAGTDAVNVSQLAGVSATADNAVQYDAGVPLKASVTLAGPASINGGVTGGTTITNLHQGALTPTSTDAVNGSQLFATNNTVSNIFNTSSKYYQANSTNPGSSAVGTDSLAAGPQALSTGASSIAIGSNASSGSQNAIAIGTGASATFANSVALGNGSATTVGARAGYAAIGLAAPQTSLGEVNVGTRQITGVAAGSAGTDAVNVNQLAGVSATASNAVQYDTGVPQKASVTLAGPVSTDGGVTGGTLMTNLHQGALTAASTDAVNGSQLFATNNTVSNIFNTSSKYYQANSTGTASSALGTDSLASGPQAVATGNGSIADGSGATTFGVNSVAIGTNASVTPGNSIALGAGSLAQRGALANYTAYGLTPLQNSVGEVSVGAVGAERQITNVAAGQAATDAVNVAQLQGVSASAANAVQYDTTVPLRASVTLAGPVSTDGGLTGGTLITNLHRGALTPTSTDAVNGAQLYGWTLDPNNPYSNTSLYNSFFNTPANKYLSVSSLLPGATTSGVGSIALGPVATATADNALALGTGANASMANSIALGSGSVTTVGARINYVGYGLAAPQTSAGELNVGNRQITGVAAASTPDGAVNLAQLQAVIGTGGTPTPASKLAVLYTPDAAGNPTNAVALTGDETGAPVAITNVAAGAETPTSTAAVNGSQVWHWSQDTTNLYSNTSLYNDITALGAGGTSSKYVQVNSTLAGATASGSNSVAVGPAATASGANSVAVGNGAQATAANSVALGAGSIATRDNTVSVGSPGAERQVTNVASGTADTDAANVGQVNAGVQQAQNWATSYTNEKFGALSSEIQQVGNRANAGVAAAMAMAGLPQAYEPGKSMAAVAAGTFRSESSIAVGVSTISEGGRWVYKMTGSVDSRGDGGVSVGAGMQW